MKLLIGKISNMVIFDNKTCASVAEKNMFSSLFLVLSLGMVPKILLYGTKNLNILWYGSNQYTTYGTKYFVYSMFWYGSYHEVPKTFHVFICGSYLRQKRYTFVFFKRVHSWCVHCKVLETKFC